MRTLERRVQRLEAKRGADEEATLEEAISWSYRLQNEPFDPETQRQYDEFCRRLERPKLGRFLNQAGSRHAPESAPPIASNRAALAVAAPVEPTVTEPVEPTVTAPVESTVTAPQSAPVSRAEPVFEEQHRRDELIKAVPGMRLDVLMALQRNNN